MASYGIILFVTLTGAFLWVKYWNVSTLQKGTYLLDRSTPARWGLVDVFVVCLIWIVSQSLAAITFMGVYDITFEQVQKFGLNPRFTLAIKLAELVAVLGGFAFLLAKYQHEPEEFGLSSKRFPEAVRSGLTCFVMWIPVVWIIHWTLSMLMPYSHETLSGLKNSKDFVTVVDLWLAAVILAPIIEEVLFRGVIQAWIQRCRSDALEHPDLLFIGDHSASRPDDSDAGSKKKRKQSKRPLHIPAIAITSALFGLMHWGQGLAPVSLFVLSLGLGYLYQRTGNLVACIIAHMALNAVTMTLATFF